MKKNLIMITALLSSVLGFIDASYLTISHYKNITPPCSEQFGCEKVLTSSYSMIGPIPLALMGSIFFLGMIIIIVVYLLEKKDIFLKLFYLGSIVGVLVSIYYFSIQFFVIKAFCQYCLLSEVFSLALLASAGLKYRQNKLIKV